MPAWSAAFAAEVAGVAGDGGRAADGRHPLTGTPPRGGSNHVLRGWLEPPPPREGGGSN